MTPEQQRLWNAAVEGNYDQVRDIIKAQPALLGDPFFTRQIMQKIWQYEQKHQRQMDSQTQSEYRQIRNLLTEPHLSLPHVFSVNPTREAIVTAFNPPITDATMTADDNHTDSFSGLENTSQFSCDTHDTHIRKNKSGRTIDVDSGRYLPENPKALAQKLMKEKSTPQESQTYSYEYQMYSIQQMISVGKKLGIPYYVKKNPLEMSANFEPNWEEKQLEANFNVLSEYRIIVPYSRLLEQWLNKKNIPFTIDNQLLDLVSAKISINGDLVLNKNQFCGEASAQAGIFILNAASELPTTASVAFLGLKFTSALKFDVGFGVGAKGGIGAKFDFEKSECQIYGILGFYRGKGFTLEPDIIIGKDKELSNRIAEKYEQMKSDNLAFKGMISEIEGALEQARNKPVEHSNKIMGMLGECWKQFETSCYEEDLMNWSSTPLPVISTASALLPRFVKTNENTKLSNDVSPEKSDALAENFQIDCGLPNAKPTINEIMDSIAQGYQDTFSSSKSEQAFHLSIPEAHLKESTIPNSSQPVPSQEPQINQEIPAYKGEYKSFAKETQNPFYDISFKSRTSEETRIPFETPLAEEPKSKFSQEFRTKIADDFKEDSRKSIENLVTPDPKAAFSHLLPEKPHASTSTDFFWDSERGLPNYKKEWMIDNSTNNTNISFTTDLLSAILLARDTVRWVGKKIDYHQHPEKKEYAEIFKLIEKGLDTPEKTQTIFDLIERSSRIDQENKKNLRGLALSAIDSPNSGLVDLFKSRYLGKTTDGDYRNNMDKIEEKLRSYVDQGWLDLETSRHKDFFHQSGEKGASFNKITQMLSRRNDDEIFSCFIDLIISPNSLAQKVISGTPTERQNFLETVYRHMRTKEKIQKFDELVGNYDKSIRSKTKVKNQQTIDKYVQENPEVFDSYIHYLIKKGRLTNKIETLQKAHNYSELLKFSDRLASMADNNPDAKDAFYYYSRLSAESSRQLNDHSGAIRKLERLLENPHIKQNHEKYKATTDILNSLFAEQEHDTFAEDVTTRDAKIKIGQQIETPSELPLVPTDSLENNSLAINSKNDDNYLIDTLNAYLVKNNHEGNSTKNILEAIDYFKQHENLLQAQPDKLEFFESTLQEHLSDAFKNNDFTAIADIQKSLPLSENCHLTRDLCREMTAYGQHCAGFMVEMGSAVIGNFIQTRVKNEPARCVGLMTCAGFEIAGTVVANTMGEQSFLLNQLREGKLNKVETEKARKILTDFENDGWIGCLSQSGTYYTAAYVLKRLHDGEKNEEGSEKIFDKMLKGGAVVSSVIGVGIDIANQDFSGNTARGTLYLAVTADSALGTKLLDNTFVKNVLPRGIDFAVAAGNDAVVMHWFSSNEATTGKTLYEGLTNLSPGLLITGFNLSASVIDWYNPKTTDEEIIKRGEYIYICYGDTDSDFWEGVKLLGQQAQQAMQWGVVGSKAAAGVSYLGWSTLASCISWAVSMAGSIAAGPVAAIIVSIVGVNVLDDNIKQCKARRIQREILLNAKIATNKGNLNRATDDFMTADNKSHEKHDLKKKQEYKKYSFQEYQKHLKDKGIGLSESMLKVLVQENPEFSTPYILLIDQYYDNKNYPDVENYAQQYLDNVTLHDDDAISWAYLMKGEACSHQHRHAESRQHYLESLGKASSNALKHQLYELISNSCNNEIVQLEKSQNEMLETNKKIFSDEKISDKEKIVHFQKEMESREEMIKKRTELIDTNNHYITEYNKLNVKLNVSEDKNKKPLEDPCIAYEKDSLWQSYHHAIIRIELHQSNEPEHLNNVENKLEQLRSHNLDSIDFKRTLLECYYKQKKEFQYIINFIQMACMEKDFVALEIKSALEFENGNTLQYRVTLKQRLEVAPDNNAKKNIYIGLINACQKDHDILIQAQNTTKESINTLIKESTDYIEKFNALSSALIQRESAIKKISQLSDETNRYVTEYNQCLSSDETQLSLLDNPSLDHKKDPLWQIYCYYSIHLQLSQKNQTIDWKVLEATAEDLARNSDDLNFKYAVLECYHRQDKHQQVFSYITSSGMQNAPYALFIQGYHEFLTNEKDKSLATLENFLLQPYVVNEHVEQAHVILATIYGEKLNALNAEYENEKLVQIREENIEKALQLLDAPLERLEEDLSAHAAYREEEVALRKKYNEHISTQKKAILLSEQDDTGYYKAREQQKNSIPFLYRICYAETILLFSDFLSIAQYIQKILQAFIIENLFSGRVYHFHHLSQRIITLPQKPIENTWVDHGVSAVLNLMQLIIDYSRGEITALKGEQNEIDYGLNIIRHAISIEKTSRELANMMNIKITSSTIDDHVLPFLKSFLSNASKILHCKNPVELIFLSPEDFLKILAIQQYFLYPEPDNVFISQCLFIGHFLKNLKESDQLSFLTEPLNYYVLNKLSYLNNYSNTLKSWLHYFNAQPIFNLLEGINTFTNKSIYYQLFVLSLRTAKVGMAFFNTLNNHSRMLFLYVERERLLGNAKAYYYMGSLYEKGLYVEKDFIKAAICYQQAVDKGYFPADKNLDKLLDSPKVTIEQLSLLLVVFRQGEKVHANKCREEFLMQKINALSKSKNNDAGSKYSTSTMQVIFGIAGMGLIALNPVGGGLFLLSAFSYVRHEKIQSVSIRGVNFFRASFNQLVLNSEVNDAKENNVKVSAKL